MALDGKQCLGLRTQKEMISLIKEEKLIVQLSDCQLLHVFRSMNL
jgi:hypothetical protein